MPQANMNMNTPGDRKRNTMNKLLTMPAEHWDVIYDLAMECGSGDYFIGMLATIGYLRQNPIETTRMNLGDTSAD